MSNGYYFEFADGYHGWVMGWSAQEKRAQTRIHGKLIKWVKA